jgi:hypothetical protein
LPVGEAMVISDWAGAVRLANRPWNR